MKTNVELSKKISTGMFTGFRPTCEMEKFAKDISLKIKNQSLRCLNLNNKIFNEDIIKKYLK